MAVGTPLDPVVFTSSKDQPGQIPAVGDWAGVLLADGAGSSVLRNVVVQYGAGLTVSNCAPTVDAFTAVNNTPIGEGDRFLLSLNEGLLYTLL